jgi:dihydropteroate synthase
MTESEQMVKSVRANGAPVWYLLAKDEGHGFQKKKNQDFQFYATVMFVKEFLLKYRVLAEVAREHFRNCHPERSAGSAVSRLPSWRCLPFVTKSRKY